jgi:hypothetical protein
MLTKCVLGTLFHVKQCEGRNVFSLLQSPVRRARAPVHISLRVRSSELPLSHNRHFRPLLCDPIRAHTDPPEIRMRIVHAARRHLCGAARLCEQPGPAHALRSAVPAGERQPKTGMDEHSRRSVARRHAVRRRLLTRILSHRCPLLPSGHRHHLSTPSGAVVFKSPRNEVCGRGGIHNAQAPTGCRPGQTPCHHRKSTAAAHKPTPTAGRRRQTAERCRSGLLRPHTRRTSVSRSQ